MAVRHFAGLKLRIIGNGWRGQPWRIALFIFGCLFGLFFAGIGFLLFAVAGLDPQGAPHPDVAIMMLGFGGAAVVLGWLLLPLVFFGVDETLDPSRFALLPVPRHTLLAGLTVSGLVGVPALATAIATTGSIVTAGSAGGPAAAIAQALGVIAGLFLCLIGSRAVTSAFASMLRSRKMRDLAAVLLTVLAALIGPLQMLVMSMVGNADWDRVAAVARVVGWTPFGAPYTVGLEVAEGRPLFAAAKLAGTLVLLAALLWWWSRSLESAMAGSTAPSGAPPTTSAVMGGPVATLFPRLIRWLPDDRYGALVAREVRYWWRDARRRATLITMAMVGAFVPFMMNFSGPILGETQLETSPVQITGSMLLIGTLAALSIINQFGYDGSAYAAHLAVGVPGRTELHARVTAFSLYMVPLLVGIGVALALLVGRPGLLPAILGGLAGAYGVGMGINTLVSVIGAYALPETSNPFAVNTGGGAAKSLLSFVSLVGSVAAAAPFLVGAVLLGDTWTVLALPLGLGYGIGAVLLGCYIGGDVLDRRAPELLQAVTPRN